MIEYTEIQSYMEGWSKKTYRDGLDDYWALKRDESWCQIAVEYLSDLGLDEREMDGDSFRGLRKNDIRTSINFTKVFNRGLEGRFFTPAVYFAELVKDATAKKMTQDEVRANLSRGMLSLPSFMRERDLANKMLIEFKERGIVPAIEMNAELDMGDHTDLLVKLRGREYRVWSYLATPRGIPNAKKKLLGKRGALKNGYYILCPVSSATVDKRYGWWLYPEEQVANAVDLMLSEDMVMTYKDFTADIDAYVSQTCKFLK